MRDARCAGSSAATLAHDVEALAGDELHEAPRGGGGTRPSLAHLHTGSARGRAQIGAAAQEIACLLKRGPGDARVGIPGGALHDDRVQSLRFADRQRPVSDCVQQREHRRRATDPQGQRHCRDRRQQLVAHEQAGTAAQVVEELGDKAGHERDAGASGVPEGRGGLSRSVLMVSDAHGCWGLCAADPSNPENGQE
jgi:hypothetical protein